MYSKKERYSILGYIFRYERRHDQIKEANVVVMQSASIINGH